MDRYKIKELAQLIGTLVSCCPAFNMVGHIKDMERKKYLILVKAKGNYEA